MTIARARTKYTFEHYAKLLRTVRAQQHYAAVLAAG